MWTSGGIKLGTYQSRPLYCGSDVNRAASPPDAVHLQHGLKQACHDHRWPASHPPKKPIDAASQTRGPTLEANHGCVCTGLGMLLLAGHVLLVEVFSSVRLSQQLFNIFSSESRYREWEIRMRVSRSHFNGLWRDTQATCDVTGLPEGSVADAISLALSLYYCRDVNFCMTGTISPSCPYPFGMQETDFERIRVVYLWCSGQ